MSRLLIALAGFLVPLAAWADPSGIKVEHAWTRAALVGRTGAIYLTITDSGPPDLLTAVSTPVAETAHLHESFSENGVMKMRPVDALAVAADQPRTLAPGGYHVMLTGLKQALTKGESFPLTLTFEHAPAVMVQVRVESAGAPGPTSTGGSGQEMDMPKPMK